MARDEFLRKMPGNGGFIGKNIGKSWENVGKSWENPDLVRFSFVPDGDFMELLGVE